MRWWALLAMVLGICSSAMAAECGTTDHGGADFTVASGDVLWGEHTNVGRFVVPAGVTARVKAMDREASTSPRLYGWLEIQAREVEIAGTVDASGAGYTGGGGGQGLYQYSDIPGRGDYDDDNNGFFTGEDFYCLNVLPHGIPGPCYAGVGARGDGPTGGFSAPCCSDGGYRDVGRNGDSSVDDSVDIGSGGAGGTGLNGVQIASSGSGGGGGRGGGMIRIVAAERISIEGSVIASGRLGQNAHPMEELGSTFVAAGNSSPEEEGAPYPLVDDSSGYGGAGAGGGILLKGRIVEITSTARVVSTGGGNQVYNGGTVKVLAEDPRLPSDPNTTLRAGRVYVKVLDQTSIPVTNHAGADFVLADGDQVSGLHTNVGRFLVPAGVTATVRPVARNSSTAVRLHGWLEVHAREVEVAGTLDASRAGYTGGGGGLGIRQDGTPGRGDYADDAGGFFDGSRYRIVTPLPNFKLGGGAGGSGDGPWAGLDGGYRGRGVNGDYSPDTSVDIGSGAAGGYGLSASATTVDGPGEPSGGGGGRGGGSIALYAELRLALTGTLAANGRLGQNAHAAINGQGVTVADGGNSSPAEQGARFPADGWGGPEEPGGQGGAGAGGGILLFAPTVDIATSATISNSGGGDRTVNGGTVKIFALELKQPPAAANAIRTGRLFITPTNPREYGSQDHGGGDLIVANGDVLWGEHTNVGRFVVPAGATATVRPVSRKSSSTVRLHGWLEVHAREVEVAGTLDASGAGYTGGGGGLGIRQHGTPGRGDYADDAGGFFDGSRYGFVVPFPDYRLGGGPGGPGDGPCASFDGGYRAPDINGDDSTDASVDIGSGARGGYGLSSSGTTLYGPGEPSGGGGGRGGGSVALYADHRLVVTGRLLAKGLLGQNAHTGINSQGVTMADGGNSSPAEQGARFPADGWYWPEEPGGQGGSGAGGGILLFAPTVDIATSATISNSGGGDRTVNGGTVKIFARELKLPPGAANSIRTGRLFIAPTTPGEHGPQDHGGGDLVAVDGDVLWGEHTNVGRFVVPAGVTATVKPMDRDSSTSPRMYGSLSVHAREIEVAGTLDASGAGYTGGGGGMGWDQARPGEGDYEDDWGGRFAGSTPYRFEFFLYDGYGHPGDGPWAGDYLHRDSIHGGYRRQAGNGDYSVDRSVDIGSGGQGGVTPQDFGRSWSGGGGGRGGGAIRLTASERLSVTGSVLARGLWGQNAHRVEGGGSAGGNSSPAEQGATVGATEAQLAARGYYFGGGGAGGGILLDAPAVTIAASATIANPGGGDRTVNGGTVKIFTEQLSLPTRSIIQTGRLYVNAPARTDAWVLE